MKNEFKINDMSNKYVTNTVNKYRNLEELNYNERNKLPDKYLDKYKDKEQHEVVFQKLKEYL